MANFACKHCNKINENRRHCNLFCAVFSRYIVDPITGCHNWTGTLTYFGHGHLNTGPRNNVKGWKAHRAAWIAKFGDIPANVCVCHKCDNPKCINTDHLFLGTKRDNTQDMIAKGRWKPPPVHSGDNHPLRRNPEFRSFGAANGNSREARARREGKQVE